MGIYDREYYRDESRGFALFNGVAPACKAIIAVNVAVFLAQWIAQEIDLYGLLSAGATDIFRHGRVWELLTAAFFHTDPIHILLNMWIFWMVGREIESIYGSREFALFYLTAAVLGTLVWAALNLAGPAAGAGRMYGASGAVAAVFVVYAMYYPMREVLLFFVLPVPMWLAAVLFFGIDFLFLTQQLGGRAPSAGVAFAAHLAGGAYGFAYKRFDLRWSRLLRPARFRPRLRVVRPEPRDPVAPRPAPAGRSTVSGAGPHPAPVPAEPPERFDERLDEVLAKIAREGKGGLTEEENLLLQEASRRARSRRSDRV
jgi:membrane associated rhomboid family serine protease